MTASIEADVSQTAGEGCHTQRHDELRDPKRGEDYHRVEQLVSQQVRATCRAAIIVQYDRQAAVDRDVSGQS